MPCHHSRLAIHPWLQVLQSMGHGVQQQLRALDDDLLTHLDEDFARRRRDKVWDVVRESVFFD